MHAIPLKPAVGVGTMIIQRPGMGDVDVNVVMPAALHKKIRQLAKTANVSVSEYIAGLCEHAVNVAEEPDFGAVLKSGV